MTEQRVPTVAKPASAYLSSGVAVTIVGFVVLLASAYFGVTAPPTDFEAGPSVALAWAGWIALAGGVALLWVGVLRLVQHADRKAGITYPAGVVSTPPES